jgi:hypothetical protein
MTAVCWPAAVDAAATIPRQMRRSAVRDVDAADIVLYGSTANGLPSIQLHVLDEGDFDYIFGERS